MRVELLNHLLSGRKQVNGGVAVIVNVDGVQFPWVVKKVGLVLDIG